MTLRSIDLTRRRLLATATTVGVAGGAAGVGTVATLSDSETSANNAVRSGSLDLTLDGGDAAVEFLSETGVAPGQSGTATVTVANAGSIPGALDVTASNLTRYENGVVGDENSADGSGGDPGVGNGELQSYLEVHAEFRDGPALWSGYDTVAARLSTGTTYDLDYPLAPGASDEFRLDWRLPTDTGADAQSDGIDLELTFRLRQQ